MNRCHLISAVAGILATLRAAGGGTGRIQLQDGKPALGATGFPVIVPADMRDGEIKAQAALYASDLTAKPVRPKA